MSSPEARIVDNLDAAMADLSNAFGLHWAAPQLAEGNVHLGDGPAHRRLRLTFSVEGPHHIELIQIRRAALHRDRNGGMWIELASSETTQEVLAWISRSKRP